MIGSVRLAAGQAVAVVAPQAVAVAATQAMTQAPVVLAGAAVRVVRAEENVRLEVAGVAQASGRLGDRVRVLLGGEQAMVGVVRGVGLVELEP